ncbi:riboflavin synthase subunit alpha [Vibrio sp. 10N.286.49.B3]|uniref:riboflavin synthase subunit alpha n=1 Tax=Vibrio sp. 10N.286.49.B3 TaxID=1880855 RepID=UPI000C84CCD2|nr:riboflavin synthase subunit alpha [Vibrio sp. 10N.286.49.B3]PMH44936.1 riboflavin synthase subunit alpha [Vibrio sp. 10N.286.49.B3]
MFTGIVQGLATVVAIEEKDCFQTHIIELTESQALGLKVGASVAHNGCCLTVTKVEPVLREVAGGAVSVVHASFDLMQATLRLTNLGKLSPLEQVNIERAAKFGDEIGGHNMSGHISLMAQIDEVVETPNNRTLWFKLPTKEAMNYIFAKGYIGIDGCSLTIGEVEEQRFSVHLIPETLQRTLFGSRKVSEWVNIEFDPQTQVIVDTVERVLAQKLS